MNMEAKKELKELQKVIANAPTLKKIVKGVKSTPPTSTTITTNRGKPPNTNLLKAATSVLLGTNGPLKNGVVIKKSKTQPIDLRNTPPSILSSNITTTSRAQTITPIDLRNMSRTRPLPPLPLLEPIGEKSPIIEHKNELFGTTIALEPVLPPIAPVDNSPIITNAMLNSPVSDPMRSILPTLVRTLRRPSVSTTNAIHAHPTMKLPEPEPPVIEPVAPIIEPEPPIIEPEPPIIEPEPPIILPEPEPVSVHENVNDINEYLSNIFNNMSDKVKQISCENDFITEPEPPIIEPEPPIIEPEPPIIEPEPPIIEPEQPRFTLNPLYQAEPKRLTLNPLYQAEQPIPQQPVIHVHVHHTTESSQQPVVHVHIPDIYKTPEPVAAQPVIEVTKPVEMIPQPVIEVTKPVEMIPQPVIEVVKPVEMIPQPVIEVTKPVEMIPQPVMEIALPEPVRKPKLTKKMTLDEFFNDVDHVSVSINKKDMDNIFSDLHSMLNDLNTSKNVEYVKP
jgi:hypothetical protein